MLEIKMLDPNLLKPYFRNPRNNDKSTAALVQIIPKVGFNVPIVVDKEMVIIKGHSRWNAARILDLKEVPVIISEASEEQNERDRILDNAIHELTEWDYDKLKIEIKETGIDLDKYRLKWVAEIEDVRPIGEKEEKNYMLDIKCPNCKKDLKYTTKELLGK